MFEVKEQDGTVKHVNADRAEVDSARNRVVFYREEEVVAMFVAASSFSEVEA